MRLYRISNYADLSGKGGELASGRWHTQAPGKRIVYLADHAALALLERLVQVDHADELPDSYQLLAVEVQDSEIAWLHRDQLSHSWSHDLAETQAVGNRFLAQADKLALMVPSALVPFGDNCILNPKAAGAGALRVEVLGRYLNR